jgi:hypothetical protein
MPNAVGAVCAMLRDMSTATDVAMQAHQAAIDRNPTSPLPVYSLARLCRRRGSMELWRELVNVALAMPHLTVEDFWERGPVKLTLGDWSGWQDRTARLLHPAASEHRDMQIQRMLWTSREWNGSDDLSEQTLLIIGDGGFGDCIQMLRFVPCLARSVGHVILAVEPELVSLAAHNFGHCVTVAEKRTGYELPFDQFTWINSLPALLGSLPSFEGLSPPQPRRVDSPNVPQIGVCWTGNSRYAQNERRSLPISTLGSLLNLPGLQWCSLQVGERASEAAAYSVVVQPAPPLQSFADTANAIAGLDAVVTVDTSVAHLAGSLNVPTFLMLHFVSEFRWELSTRSSWYPSMRLIRQPRPGDWAGAVDILAEELKARHWMPQ